MEMHWSCFAQESLSVALSASQTPAKTPWQIPQGQFLTPAPCSTPLTESDRNVVRKLSVTSVEHTTCNECMDFCIDVLPHLHQWLLCVKTLNQLFTHKLTQAQPQPEEVG